MTTFKQVSLAYNGTFQDWVVPSDVGDTLYIDLYGPGGTFTTDGAGGLTQIQVINPQQYIGQTIRFRIGGNGFAASGGTGGAGGFNGGARGGNSSGSGGLGGYGGSGATDIRLPAIDDTLAGRKAVAGGAGSTGRGGTGNVGGAGGASTGAAGGNGSGGSTGGGGGTQAAGGAKGTPGAGAGDSADPGTLGNGGAGSDHATTNAYSGGGGGGGYYGGGGGGGAISTVGGSAGGGGGSNFINTSFATTVASVRGGGQAHGLDGKANIFYVPTPQAPTSVTFVANYDAEGLVTTVPMVVNPDHEVTLQWRYQADTTNLSPHWKSLIEVNYPAINSTYTSIFADDVAPYYAISGSIIQVRIPAGTFTAGTASINIRVKDMNIADPVFGPGTVLNFSTPTRPATPVWVTPAVAGNPNPVHALPFRASWTSTTQAKWRIQQYAIEDTGFLRQLWDSGWQSYSTPAGLVMPDIIGGTFVWRLTTHDGKIASLPANVTVVLDPSMPVSDWKPLKPKIELEVYNRFGTFISNVPGRIDPHYLEEHRGAGAGDFTILLTDATYAANPTLIDAQNIVRVKIGGKYIGFWEITGHTSTVVATDEGAAESILVRGLGGNGAWPPKAIVFPERGTQDFNSYPATIRSKRAFGVMSNQNLGHWFSTTQWSPTFVEVQQNATGNPTTWPASTANPWKSAPSDWPTDLVTAQWISYEDFRQWGFAGVDVFAFNMVVPAGVSLACQLFLAADDEAQAYIDGDPWVGSNGWQSTAQSEITWVGPGTHPITIISAQGQYTTDTSGWYKTPEGILAGLYIFADAGQAATHNVQWKTDGVNSVVAPHHAVLPGWTVGDVLQTLHDEAASRGVNSFTLFQLGYDFYQDSYGVPWPKNGKQWFFEIGSQYNVVYDKMTDTECDIWFSADMRQQAAPQRGIDRGQLTVFTTYEQVVKADTPFVYWDMENALSTGTIVGITGTVTYMNDWTSTRGIIFDEFSLTGLSTHWYLPAVNGSPNSNLASPSTALRGMVTKTITDAGSGNNFVSRSALTTGQLGIPVTGPEGFSLEWLTSNGFFDLLLNLFAAGADTSAGTAVVPETLEFFLEDGYFQLFGHSQLTQTYNSNTAVNDTLIKSFIAQDNHTHHFVLNFFNVAGACRAILYRDSVEIASIELAIPYVVGSLFFVLGTGSDQSKDPVHQGFGHVALYNNLLAEDTIRTHYLSMRDGGLAAVDPVIFNKGKNVQTAQSSLDYAGKTALLTKSSTQVVEVDADSTTLASVGRIEGFYDGGDANLAQAKRVAFSTIQSSLAAQAAATVDFYGTYVPWEDFDVADWVLAPDDKTGAITRRRVMSLAASEDADTAEVLYTMELDSLSQEATTRIALWLQRTLPQGNLGGLIADQG